VRKELGLETSEVVLHAHNPDWLVLGRRECDIVRRLLGGLAHEVVHVGSTSIPGLDAKPILDIVAAVDDSLSIDEVVARLTSTGEYAYDGDKREDGGLLFVRGSGTVRTVHVHVVGSSSEAWGLYRRFHDLLLTDTAARDCYQTEKRLLAAHFPKDRLGYTNAKSAVIRTMLGAQVDVPPSR
jgi:GrpB-like predicted nucleotidyltransferase (UPF0157 family)